MFDNHFRLFLVLYMVATAAFCADDRPDNPEKNTLVARLLGHQRWPL